MSKELILERILSLIDQIKVQELIGLVVLLDKLIIREALHLQDQHILNQAEVLIKEVHQQNHIALHQEVLRLQDQRINEEVLLRNRIVLLQEVLHHREVEDNKGNYFPFFINLRLWDNNLVIIPALFSDAIR